jgi:hypothetical protein
MQYKRFNTRHERAENRKLKIAESLKGEGVYVFQNNTKGDLQLPKAPIKGGVRIGNITLIPCGGKFEGDSYFMSMVRTNELRLLETLITPEQQRESAAMQEQKLILNQPDRITDKGKVEQVVTQPQVPLNEGKPSDKPGEEVLISEDPMAGVEIILE